MRTHPWHPAMVHFPVACWVLATGADAVALLPFSASIGGMDAASLAVLLTWTGLAAAVPAAAAGIVDYARLPADVQRAAESTGHVMAMSCAVLLFLTAALLRRGTSGAPVHVVALECLGTLALVVGGRYAAVVVFERIPEAARSPAGRRE